MSESRICANTECNNRFFPKREWQKYCCILCREVHYPTTLKTISIRIAPVIECPHCNQEIDLKQLKEDKNVRD